MSLIERPDAIVMRMWLPNTGALFATAASSAKGISAPSRQGGQDSALVSVVFAAASLEAFLSESVYLAEFSNYIARIKGDIGAASETAATFAQVLDDAEDSRASIESKFHLANLVLTGKAYEKGASPYQDFRLLTDLRNALVHFKSKEYFSKMDGKPATFNQEKVVEKLKSKNVLFQPSPGSEDHFHLPVGEVALASVDYLKAGRVLGLDDARRVTLVPDAVRTRWTYTISTKALAEWACSTAVNMATDLMDKIPIGSWKQNVETYLRPAFSHSWNG